MRVRSRAKPSATSLASNTTRYGTSVSRSTHDRSHDEPWVGKWRPSDRIGGVKRAAAAAPSRPRKSRRRGFALSSIIASLSNKGHNLVVDNRRRLEADGGPVLLEGEHATAAERLHAPHRPARRDFEPYALRPDGVGAVDQTPCQVGSRVGEQMQRVAWLRLPGERFQQ